jgi:hypothetical protein
MSQAATNYTRLIEYVQRSSTPVLDSMGWITWPVSSQSRYLQSRFYLDHIVCSNRATPLEVPRFIV